MEREEALANDIEQRRSLLFATIDESCRFSLKCMVIMVDNIRGLDVDTIKQLFSEIGEVSWQGRGQLGGMGCLVMPYDVGMIAIDRLNATEIKGRLLRVREALDQRIASDVAEKLSLIRYPGMSSSLCKFHPLICVFSFISSIVLHCIVQKVERSKRLIAKQY